MARYIDAEAFMQKLSRMIDYCEKDKEVNGLTALFQVGDAIMDCPTADVVEVRHGEWIWTENGEADYEQYWVCSVCGEKSYIETKYCSDCGAKMDKVVTE